jgi:hypothetical protein
MVSNCVELRLYGFGRGRIAYEVRNLAELDRPGELERLVLLLSSVTLLGGATEALLVESGKAEAEVTDKPHADYRRVREGLIETIDGSNSNLGRERAIKHVQTLLDRALFVAFAEDTGMLRCSRLEAARLRPSRQVRARSPNQCPSGRQRSSTLCGRPQRSQRPPARPKRTRALSSRQWAG